ncbi:AI-2E family transporter [Mariniflexile ostreae]|uniref:AI-2E family transporter n=1 Tax=Mariniflexile ostreae TaxID=1520892 RepID=A0ABV5FD94_9FLAO
MNTKSGNFQNHYSLNLIGFIAIIFILYVLKPIIIPLLLAMILAVLVFPVQRFLERRWRWNRLFATLVSILVIFISVASLLLIIYSQFNNFISSGEDYAEKISQLYYRIVGYFQETFNISKNDSISNDLKIENLIKSNMAKIGGFLSESGSILSNIILIPISLFFFLYFRRFLRIFLYKLFRNETKSFLNKMIGKIYRIQRNYLVGLAKVIGIVGVLNTAGLMILGIKNAIFFGFFAAFLLLIPYIGIIIGSLIPALVALATKDSAWYAFGVIAIFWFVQVLEGNIITPKITGSKVSINAFVAILSLFLFSMLWGVFGMVVALPLIASLKIIFDNTPGLKAYGFLIGEPINKHLQSEARNRLKRWRKIRGK